MSRPDTSSDFSIEVKWMCAVSFKGCGQEKYAKCSPSLNSHYLRHNSYGCYTSLNPLNRFVYQQKERAVSVRLYRVFAQLNRLSLLGALALSVFLFFYIKTGLFTLMVFNMVFSE